MPTLTGRGGLLPIMADLPTSRLGRLARLAALGTRAGASRIASALGSESSEASLANVAAEALGTMRGLALKMGQMASYVDGFVPEEHRDIYEKAMRTLRDAAPTMTPEEAAKVVASELGGPPEELFAAFSREPFASASIGQVHRAELHDGRNVAVKVQYEGVARAVAADLSNMSMITALAGPVGDKFAAKDQLGEMRARFLEELDYRHEAARQRTFAERFAGHERVRIPEVVEERSSRRVLTTMLAEGIRFDEACARSEAERVAWAETLWMFVMEGVLRHGLFNADPHPGNYLFIDSPEATGEVWFLDFGCTRTLRPEKVELVREAHRASVLRQDAGALGELFSEMLDMPAEGEGARIGREYLKLCYAPILTTGKFHITKEYTTKLFHDLREGAKAALRGSRDEFTPLPSEWLFFNRLQLGFYSVLARLDVPVDYGAVERKILESIDLESNSEESPERAR
ncbi:MAG: AarF/ABC1/UbiB kinase family protein [Polyangiaceae bacterium]|nr:AarF/ABC1/UbiB kinase family protein [Polyangiaceae bacterium]